MIDKDDDDIREFIKEYHEDKKATERHWNITALISIVILIFFSSYMITAEYNKGTQEFLEISEQARETFREIIKGE